MVSAEVESALHPRRPSVEGAAFQQESDAAMSSLSHSLQSSGKVMAALVSMPVGEYEAALAAEDAALSSPTASSRNDAAGQSAPAGSAAVDLQFRLYRGGSGMPMERVPLSAQALEKAFSSDNEQQWGRVLAPTVSALEKDLALAALLEQPLEGTPPPAAPDAPEQGDLIPQLQGAVIMQPPAALGRTATNVAYQVTTTGDAASTDFRMHMHKDGQEVSAWHDVPLRNPDGTLNFICEIPKGSSAKMEVATGEEGTPIKQDVKKGKLRHYYEGIPYNYGMLPQTWEDPNHVNNDCGGIKGDNDPVDVVEIGSKTLKSGGVYSVKALGSYAMIDEGELDWKIICIRIDDPVADKLHDIADVDREMPGMLEGIMTWFKFYKQKGEGKPPNEYGYDAKPLDAAFAERVVAETHQFYQRLRAGTHAAAVFA